MLSFYSQNPGNLLTFPTCNFLLQKKLNFVSVFKKQESLLSAES